jgi:hypothetical protein
VLAQFFKVQILRLLSEEMDAIHRAKGLYWQRGHSQSVAAKADYQFRQDRLSWETGLRHTQQWFGGTGIVPT